MKILVTGDWHPDARTAGLPRIDDVSRAAMATVRKAVDLRSAGEEVAYLFLGDLCDPDSPSLIRCQTLACEVASRLWTFGIPSVWLAGNHDVLEDGFGTTVLDPLHYVSGARLMKSPGWASIGEGSAVACLPYIASRFTYDPVEVIRMFSDHPFAKETKIVATHLMLEGISVGSETTDFARGRDVFFPIEEARRLFPDAHHVAGHYHEGQIFKRVLIPGSLALLTRSDAGREPRFLVLEV